MSLVCYVSSFSEHNCPLTYYCTGFPDPFAVATINGEQTQTTGVIKKTLNPYWNESFDLYDDSHGLVKDFVLRKYTGRPPRRAYSPFKSSIKKSSRRKTRVFLESSMFG